MHWDVYDWVEQYTAAHGPYKTVVEFGSRDINGSVRPLFPDSDYVGIDMASGRGVDLVTDATTYKPSQPVDIVVCLEVLEHADNPRALLVAMHEALHAGGTALITAACPPRQPHSGSDGGPLRAGERYENIDPALLDVWLGELFSEHRMEVHDRGDVYAAAIR